MRRTDVPAVSVLLPVKDGAATLDDAITSVTAQTLVAWELVVVVNGSRDRSEAIARTYAEADERVRLLVARTAGLVAALQVGLGSCRAPLIARMDADDVMLPDRLAAQARYLAAHPGHDLVSCGVQHEELGAPAPGMRRHVDWLNSLESPESIRAARFVDAPVAHPAVMFRADCVRELGGYGDGDFAEDHDLWLRMLKDRPVFGRVPDTLHIWRDHDGRLTRTDPRYRPDAMRALKHRHLLAGPLAGARPCRLWGAGKAGRRHARGLLALGATVEDLIDIDPRKLDRVVSDGRLRICGPNSVGPPRGTLILIAVAAAGARAEVRERLEHLGHRPERDFLAIQ